MGSSGGVLKTLFKALVFVSFIGFLIVDEIVPSTKVSSTKTTTTSKKFKRLEVIGRHTPVVHSDSIDPNNYMMSKRRVPNGPDPIHNRRAGKSRQPPGRA
ncbi:hypothetical protein BVC80_8763g22 [Macleaya cordata]|uniref:CLAVATA3/ESR (CLE)-related protein 25 n=1 Tax=Macleaya cordata TaxID=56857 RepID=A0A200QNA7_MACCD|nr:hypothetical protein BVC80_8763g22 [Macleaya cordata]